MIPSCTLDESGLRQQLARYQEIGGAARLVRRDENHLVVEVDRRIEPATVQTTVAIEQDCCPFLHPTWDTESRRLGFSVALPSERPALEAIEFALGLGGETPAPDTTPRSP